MEGKEKREAELEVRKLTAQQEVDVKRLETERNSKVAKEKREAEFEA